ncbi:MAG: hypothetical protein AAF502_14375 [Bacteroidota bacterium]
MAKKDSLFRLIKSMDRSEKGYFKKFASMYSGKRSQNYLRLFEEIDKQSNYDEKKIKEKFKGEKLLNNFSVAKNYLADTILKALKGYKVAENNRQEITTYLTSARILFKKGLFDERKTLLAKARELATQGEEFNLMVEVIAEEILSNIHNPLAGSLDRINELLKERRDIYKVMDNVDQILLFYYQVFHLRLKSMELDQIDKNDLEVIMKEPLLQDESNCLSIHSKSYFFLCWQYFFEFKEDLTKALDYSKKYLQLLRDNPDFTKRRDAQNHIFSLYNYMNRARTAGIYDEFPEVLREMKSIQPKYFALKVFLFEALTDNELIYIIHGHRLDLFEDTLNRILKGHKQFDGYMRTYSKQEHLYLVSIVYMIKGDFETALEWNLKTLDLSKEDATRQDYGLSSRLLNLIIHLELGNTYYLGNVTRSLKRFIKKNPKPLEVEKIILRFIDRLSAAPDKTTYEKHLIKMFEEVGEKLAATNRFDHTLTHFDIKCWIDSKLKNATMAEIYSSKPF